ncbi:AsnC family transcriptional regulator [Aureimonas endophytica]|uniref:AsnC family transcriptional regulator n=2 Tax=Aureimonas endophytica TaxID=2027858 RepID=A0A916ZHN3_9HYPH|nr:AsnC family transcriptional regulator [Aureimonas endophytica]
MKAGSEPAESDRGEEAVRVRGSGARLVHAALRGEILALRLSPGSPLDETGLSERFGMSRTPIREALQRLVAEGLATALPNRSTVVTPIDFAGLPAYFEALSLMYRVTTRGAALRPVRDLAAVRASQAAFAAAVAAHDAMAMIEANREFHVAIAAIHGNEHFIALFSRLLDQGRRILRIYYSTFDDRLPRQYVEEHEAMIAALEAGDAERADALASAHARQIVRQIQDFMARDVTASIDLAEADGQKERLHGR